jgi:hypothetical protein
MYPRDTEMASPPVGSCRACLGTLLEASGFAGKLYAVRLSDPKTDNSVFPCSDACDRCDPCLIFEI